MQFILFLCVFISDGALICGRRQKFEFGLIIMGIYDRWGRLLGWGLGVVPAIIYHCNAVPVVRPWTECNVYEAAVTYLFRP